MIRAAVVLLVIAYFLRRPQSPWKESRPFWREDVARLFGVPRSWVDDWNDPAMDVYNAPSWSSDALNEPTYAGGEW